MHTVVSAIENDYRCIPDKALWRLRQEASYCHYVSNETAHGLFFGDVPETHGVPLVVDMTSDLLARPINIADYGLVYAASQKNLGAAGFTVVIVRDDLLGDAPNSIPSQLDYRSYLDDPTPVTPVTFAIYLASLVTAWIGEEGGLEVMEKRNASKAKKLYDFLDESSHFDAPVLEKYRSHTNVIFQLNAPNKTPELIAFAEQSGLYGLGGHRAVGGLRASLYNAMEEEGVDALIDCLKRFVLNA